MRTARAAVLIGSKLRTHSEAAPITRLLVPTDFSDLSRGAFKFASDLAGRYRAEITLLHVVPAQLPADLTHLGIVFAEKRAARNSIGYLNTLRDRAFGGNLSVNTAVVQGDAALEIVRFARESHTDLIVMATHGYTGLKHALLGSTAEKVIRSSPCPVLLIPAMTCSPRHQT